MVENFEIASASYNGFSGKVGFVAASEISEENTGDSDDIANDSILSEASITYASDVVGITLGRQAVDFEWIGDYHEAVVASTSAIPNTALTILYTDKSAVAGVDEISSEFADVNGTKGAYVLDAKIALAEEIELNPEETLTKLNINRNKVLIYCLLNKEKSSIALNERFLWS